MLTISVTEDHRQTLTLPNTLFSHTFRPGGSQMTLYTQQRRHLLGYMLQHSAKSGSFEEVWLNHGDGGKLKQPHTFQVTF